MPIQIEALGLKEGAFIPIEAEPLQSSRDVVGEFGARSLGVGIFDPQNELPAVVTRKQPVKHRCASGADMQIAGRARRDANANGHSGGGK